MAVCCGAEISSSLCTSFSVCLWKLSPAFLFMDIAKERARSALAQREITVVLGTLFLFQRISGVVRTLLQTSPNVSYFDHGKLVMVLRLAKSCSRMG